MKNIRTLLIGSGGRESILAEYLAKSKRVQKILVLPGNSGTEGNKNTKIENIKGNFDDIIEISQRENINFVVIGPEKPLVDGITDKLMKIGIPCFGPSQAAAQLEGSKAFSKKFMSENDIKTAKYEVRVKPYWKMIDENMKCHYNVVVKLSGLAAGKGVFVTNSKEEAKTALENIFIKDFFHLNDQSREVIIEERLIGQEISMLAISDGYTVIPFPAAQDHKRAYDNDMGPNTGGMGAYAPALSSSSELTRNIISKVLQRTIDGMRKSGISYRGMLYAGMMISDEDPNEFYVLEYNCRFGDPETQVILPLLKNHCDLFEILWASVHGTLDAISIAFHTDATALTVVIASEGYPQTTEINRAVRINNDKSDKSITIYHAGTKKDFHNGEIFTTSGRILNVLCIEPSLNEARKKVYHFLDNSNHINVRGSWYRRDIGLKGFKEIKKCTPSLKYKDAGVSIAAGNRLVQDIKNIIKTTRRPGTNADIGGFGGIFSLNKAGFKSMNANTKDLEYNNKKKNDELLLVGTTDGVGTKLLLAQQMDQHNTIGIDLVAMSVNDLLVQGAEPLFFLDYVACGRLDEHVVKQIVNGIVDGCKQATCALIGGETAEMPNMYPEGVYDLAGFAVGAVYKSSLLPKEIKSGDYVYGLRSSGPHSNGYSLIRHILKKDNIDLSTSFSWDPEHTIGELLLQPTKIYAEFVNKVLQEKQIIALAHITGGGLIENIPRILPSHLKCTLDATNWPFDPLWKWIKRSGNIVHDEMARTFNCGIGMIVIVPCDYNLNFKRSCTKSYECYEIGRVVERQDEKEGQISINNMDVWDH